MCLCNVRVHGDSIQMVNLFSKWKLQSRDLSRARALDRPCSRLVFVCRVSMSATDYNDVVREECL
jgi:hypothetical protein